MPRQPRALCAGDLTKRVIYRTQASTSDRFGDLTPAWTIVGTFWAKAEDVAGLRPVVAGQMKAEATHLLTLRWPGTAATFTPNGQFLLGSRVLSILSVLNVDERNRVVLVDCTEVIAPA